MAATPPSGDITGGAIVAHLEDFYIAKDVHNDLVHVIKENLDVYLRINSTF